MTPSRTAEAAGSYETITRATEETEDAESVEDLTLKTSDGKDKETSPVRYSPDTSSARVVGFRWEVRRVPKSNEEGDNTQNRRMDG